MRTSPSEAPEPSIPPSESFLRPLSPGQGRTILRKHSQCGGSAALRRRIERGEEEIGANPNSAMSGSLPSLPVLASCAIAATPILFELEAEACPERGQTRQWLISRGLVERTIRSNPAAAGAPSARLALRDRPRWPLLSSRSAVWIGSSSSAMYWRKSFTIEDADAALLLLERLPGGRAARTEPNSTFRLASCGAQVRGVLGFEVRSPCGLR